MQWRRGRAGGRKVGVESKYENNVAKNGFHQSSKVIVVTKVKRKNASRTVSANDDPDH